MATNNNQPKQKKGGRPKGSKSELGIPIKSIKEAVELTRMAYESGKGSVMSFSEMAGYMGLKKGPDTPTIGALKMYGLVEQSDGGWRVSELGLKAIRGDKESIRTAFEKVELFRELSSQFAEKNVSPGFIIDYLKKKYRKGDNEKRIITQRFLEGIEYIKGLSVVDAAIQSDTLETLEVSDVIQLKYALSPPTDTDIEHLADGVYNKYKTHKSSSIRILADNIHKNKSNKEALRPLVDTLLGIMENSAN